MNSPNGYPAGEEPNARPSPSGDSELSHQAAEARINAIIASIQGTGDAGRHLDDAISSLCKLIELDPTNVERHLELGEACKQRCLYDEAIAVYTEAIHLDPRCWVAYQSRGWVHALEDHREEALRDCEAAISIHPSLSTRLARAEVYSLLEDYLPAIADCDEAVRLEPRNPDGYAKRALLLAEWFAEAETPDLLHRAIEDDTIAIELEPDKVDHLRRRGRDYLDLGCFDKAIEDLSSCIDREPDFYLNYEIRGEAYFKDGRPELALKDLDRAIALSPDAVYAIEFRSKTHRVLGNLKMADADEQRWKELDPYWEEN